MPDELWTEVHDIVQETGIKTIPKKKKCKKAKCLGLALGSPIFPSGCEGKLGVALESLQGRRACRPSRHIDGFSKSPSGSTLLSLSHPAENGELTWEYEESQSPINQILGIKTSLTSQVDNYKQ